MALLTTTSGLDHEHCIALLDRNGFIENAEIEAKLGREYARALKIHLQRTWTGVDRELTISIRRNVLMWSRARLAYARRRRLRALS